MHQAKIGTRNQITVPAAVRQQLALCAGDLVHFKAQAGGGFAMRVIPRAATPKPAKRRRAEG